MGLVLVDLSHLLEHTHTDLDISFKSSNICEFESRSPMSALMLCLIQESVFLIKIEVSSSFVVKGISLPDIEFSV